jgi:hypothetical protein
MKILLIVIKIMDWLSYIIVIIITALITSIIVEKSVIKRISYSDGVVFANGMCRLAKGYGKV